LPTPASAIYVPYTLPGETVEVDRWPSHPDRRHLIRVETPSPQRIAPICPHFGICGGCAVQHWATEHYRNWKRALVVGALAQAGIDPSVDDLIDAHGEGRRRAVFHARRGQRDVLEVGFAALRAHHVVAIDRCPILAPGLDGAIESHGRSPSFRRRGQPLDIRQPRRRRLRCRRARIGPPTAARMSELARLPSAGGWRGRPATESSWRSAWCRRSRWRASRAAARSVSAATAAGELRWRSWWEGAL
jgi:23S rRNA (uracil1939-C5)-methyltransferase